MGCTKEHKQSGRDAPMAHTCKDGDFESTANCPACKWLKEKAEKRIAELQCAELKAAYAHADPDDAQARAMFRKLLTLLNTRDP